MKVSVITPTANRPEMLKRCIEGFLSQDYVDKQIIIEFDIQRDCKTAQYFNENKDSLSKQNILFITSVDGKTIGRKRNHLNHFSECEIVLHMDDDDIYASDWITKSVAALVSSRAAIVGLASYYSHKVDTNNIFEYSRQPNSQLYLPEATLCYWKSTWERKQFKDTSHGEGLDFISNNGKLFAHDYKDGFLATIHGGNTESHKALPIMKKVSPLEETRLLKHFYGS